MKFQKVNCAYIIFAAFEGGKVGRVGLWRVVSLPERIIQQKQSPSSRRFVFSELAAVQLYLVSAMWKHSEMYFSPQTTSLTCTACSE